MTCSGSSASFCTGGRLWVRRTPASTVATWRSLRSKGRARWAKFHTSAESRRSIVPTVRGFGPARRRRAPRDRGRRIRGRRAAQRGPGGRASADSRASRRRRRGWCSGGRRAGVGAGGLDERLEFCGEGGPARLFERRWGRGAAHAGRMSVRAKSAPLNRRASPVALASA